MQIILLFFYLARGGISVTKIFLKVVRFPNYQNSQITKLSNFFEANATLHSSKSSRKLQGFALIRAVLLFRFSKNVTEH